MTVIPAFLLLRGNALRRWLAIEFGAWILLGALALFVHPFQIQIDPYLAVVTFGVCVIAAFFACVALADPHARQLPRRQGSPHVSPDRAQRPPSPRARGQPRTAA